MTLYFNGGRKFAMPTKEGEKTNLDKCREFDPFIDEPHEVSIYGISISPNFITVKVSSVGGIPYFGNPTMHVTIGISTTSGKKLKPVDSPTAFDDANATHIRAPCGCFLVGIVGKVTK